ncbi:hypothetical protein HAX54_025455, partial [Datura stramonium]|nr:hypothetical protein [Datura stramonium]
FCGSSATFVLENFGGHRAINFLVLELPACSLVPIPGCAPNSRCPTIALANNCTVVANPLSIAIGGGIGGATTLGACPAHNASLIRVTGSGGGVTASSWASEGSVSIGCTLL